MAPMQPRFDRVRRRRLSRQVVLFLRRHLSTARSARQGREASPGTVRQIPEPLVALWQFTWACMVLIVGSRYLWLIGVTGAGR